MPSSVLPPVMSCITCCIRKIFKVSQNNAGLFNKKEEEEYNADVFAAYLLLPEMGLKELVPAEEQQVDKITLATLLKVEQNFLCSRAALLTRVEGLEMGLPRKRLTFTRKMWLLRQSNTAIIRSCIILLIRRNWWEIIT